MGPYTISAAWLIALVFAPFVVGVLAGATSVKRAITAKLLKTLTIDEFKEITGWKE